MDFNRDLVTYTIILYYAEVILFICVQYPFFNAIRNDNFHSKCLQCICVFVPF